MAAWLLQSARFQESAHGKLHDAEARTNPKSPKPFGYSDSELQEASGTYLAGEAHGQKSNHQDDNLDNPYARANRSWQC
jgi:hypothetical protein